MTILQYIGAALCGGALAGVAAYVSVWWYLVKSEERNW